jgi:hypothetical protein
LGKRLNKLSSSLSCCSPRAITRVRTRGDWSRRLNGENVVILDAGEPRPKVNDDVGIIDEFDATNGAVYPINAVHYYFLLLIRALVVTCGVPKQQTV